MRRVNVFVECIFAAGFVLVGVSTSVTRLQAQDSMPGTGSMTGMAHKASPISNNLTLAIDGKLTTLSIADLQAFPQKSVTVHNEHTKLDETCIGVLLSDLLAKYGLPMDQSTHRKILRSYLVAKGADQYRVVLSATEVEGSAHNGDVLVATQGGGKPLGEDGALKLIVSEDKKPARWVRNLSSITLKSVD